MNTTDNGVTCTGNPITGQPTPGPQSSESKPTTLAPTAVTVQVTKTTAKTTPGTTRSNVPVSKPSKKPSDATPNSTRSNIPVSKPSKAPTTTKSPSSFNATEGIVEFKKGKNSQLLTCNADMNGFIIYHWSNPWVWASWSSVRLPAYGLFIPYCTLVHFSSIGSGNQDSRQSFRLVNCKFGYGNRWRSCSMSAKLVLTVVVQMVSKYNIPWSRGFHYINPLPEYKYLETEVLFVLKVLRDKNVKERGSENVCYSGVQQTGQVLLFHHICSAHSVKESEYYFFYMEEDIHQNLSHCINCDENVNNTKHFNFQLMNQRTMVFLREL